MSDDEKEMALALSSCTFVPGIGTKRFARNMAFLVQNGEPCELTEKQRLYLYTAVYRFRRQISNATVAKAVIAKAALLSKQI